MLQIKTIRTDSQDFVKLLEKRGLKEVQSKMDSILELDKSLRKKITSLEEIRKEQNASAKKIGLLFGQGKVDEANAAKVETANLKEKQKELETEEASIRSELDSLLVLIPNVPHASVPAGVSEENNEIVFQNREPKELFESALPHWELCTKHGIIDWELGSKISGAGFPVYLGKGAKLQRSLIQFFLDEAENAGFLEVQPPLLVNEASGFGTGQLPDKEGQMYHCPVDNLYLIPTAEVPITNLFRDVILKKSDFPVKRCGYTPCFRREAGSYGKDVRGLNRLHQFDKVEIVIITEPKGSYDVLETMKAHVESLLVKLGLPYRVLNLCGGDLGFNSAKTYDMEVYSSAQKRWLEVSSVSNFETFQSNRLKLRYKDENQKIQLAHTLNGSALALPRILASIIENYQLENGDIVIPEALHKYTGFEKISL